MPAALDLTGDTFGRLTVVARAEKDRWGAWLWNCRCACGRVVAVRAATLASGRTSACASCATTAAKTTHGQTGTALYGRWRAMLARCEDPGNRAWANYGGRGIEVCPEWHDFKVFADDMGAAFRPELELDRIDPDGHYKPENCRWADRITQQNNRRNNHRVTWRGQTRTVTEWALILGVRPNTLLYRIRRGWPLERAMTFRVDPVLLSLANPPENGVVQLCG